MLQMLGIGLHFGSAASTDNDMKFYGHPRNHGFIPCWEKRFIPFSKFPEWLWGLSIQWIPWAFFCMGRVAKAWIWPLTWRMHGTLPPLPSYAFMVCVQGHCFLYLRNL